MKTFKTSSQVLDFPDSEAAEFRERRPRSGRAPAADFRRKKLAVEFEKDGESEMRITRFRPSRRHNVKKNEILKSSDDTRSFSDIVISKDMNPDLFESFARMIEDVPVENIVRLLERESQLLQHELAFGKASVFEQIISILCFCRFVDADRRGLSKPLLGISIPDYQLEFYRKTVSRLAEATELPPEAEKRFEEYFERRSGGQS